MGEQVLQPLPGLFGEGVELLGLTDVPLEPDLDLHAALLDDALPDVGAFDTHVDARAAQDVGIADAGAFEQERALDRSGAHDYLLASAVLDRLRPLSGPLPAHPVPVDHAPPGPA